MYSRRDLLRGIARVAGELAGLADRASSEIRRPIEDALRDALAGVVWRLEAPALPSLEETRRALEESLGGPLEEVLSAIAEKYGSSGRGERRATGRGERSSRSPGPGPGRE